MTAKQFFPEVLLVDEGADFPPYGTGAKVSVEPARDASQARGRTAYLREDLAISTAEAKPAAAGVPIEQHQAVIAQRDRAQAENTRLTNELEAAHNLLRQADAALGATAKKGASP